MYRAPRVVCNIVDRQMREAADKKHREALKKMKPKVDVSKPPPVPRLVVYEKHQTRDRLIQMELESENIRTIQEIERENMRTRQSIRERRTNRNSGSLIDWTQNLKLSQKPQTSNASTRKRGNSVPYRMPEPQEETSLFEQPSEKEIIEDEGMVVVDSKPKSPIRLLDKSPRRQKEEVYDGDDNDNADTSPDNDFSENHDTNHIPTAQNTFGGSDIEDDFV